MNSTPIKVAIVGSGIAGLSMAYFLSHPLQKGKFEATIYECHHRLGMDSQSIQFSGNGYADGTFSSEGSEDRVDGQDATHFVLEQPFKQSTNETTPTSSTSIDSVPIKPHVRIDMPLRVFSTRYYPHLTRLLETIHIKYRPENYEASFAEFAGKSIFKYRNFLFRNYSIPYIKLSTIWTPLFKDMIRFLVQAPKDLRNGRLIPPPGLITTFDLMSDAFDPSSLLYANPTSSNSQPQQSQPQCETLLQYLKNENYCDEFIYHFEIPTVASICTCSYESASNYPAFLIVQYQTLRSGGGVRRVESGANIIVSRLSQYSQVKTNAAVVRLIPFIDPNTNLPKITLLDSQDATNDYDHVIFATQANQTSKILYRSIYTPDDGNTTISLSTPCDALTTILPPTSLSQSPSTIQPNIPENWITMYNTLTRIPYESSELILHGDASFLPIDRDDWANVNFLLPPLDQVKQMVNTPATASPTSSPAPSTPQSPESDQHLSEKWMDSISRQSSSHSQSVALVLNNTRFVSQDEGMSTIWMNKVQHGIQNDINIFQTWNPYTKIIPQGREISNLYGRSFFQRPVVTFDSVQACNRLWAHNGEGNIWSIGSFSLGGVPLLEVGVASALVVAKRLHAVNILDHTAREEASTLSPESASTSSSSDQSSSTKVAVKSSFPILGWVNTASPFNIAFEFILYLVYLFFFITGAYSQPILQPGSRQSDQLAPINQPINHKID